MAIISTKYLKFWNSNNKVGRIPLSSFEAGNSSKAFSISAAEAEMQLYFLGSNWPYGIYIFP